MQYEILSEDIRSEHKNTTQHVNHNHSKNKLSPTTQKYAISPNDSREHQVIITYGALPPHIMSSRMGQVGTPLTLILRFSRTGQNLPQSSHSSLHVRVSQSPHPCQSSLHVRGCSSPNPDPAAQVFTYGAVPPHTLALGSSRTGQSLPNPHTQVSTYGEVPPPTLTLRSSRTGQEFPTP